MSKIHKILLIGHTSVGQTIASILSENNNIQVIDDIKEMHKITEMSYSPLFNEKHRVIEEKTNFSDVNPANRKYQSKKKK